MVQERVTNVSDGKKASEQGVLDGNLPLHYVEKSIVEKDIVPNVANGLKNPSVFLKICGLVKKQRVVCGGVLKRREVRVPNVMHHRFVKK